MPFKSKAQMRYMYAALKRRQIKPSVVEEFQAATPDAKKLPEKVQKPVKKK